VSPLLRSAYFALLRQTGSPGSAGRSGCAGLGRQATEEGTSATPRFCAILRIQDGEGVSAAAEACRTRRSEGIRVERFARIRLTFIRNPKCESLGGAEAFFFARTGESYTDIFVTTPAPTVLPPSPVMNSDEKQGFFSRASATPPSVQGQRKPPLLLC